MKHIIRGIPQLVLIILLTSCVPMYSGKAAKCSIQELDEFSITLCCDAYLERNPLASAMLTLGSGLSGKKTKRYRRNVCGVNDLLTAANKHFGYINGEESANLIRVFKKVAGSTAVTDGEMKPRWDNKTSINAESNTTLIEVTCATFEAEEEDYEKEEYYDE